MAQPIGRLRVVLKFASIVRNLSGHAERIDESFKPVPNSGKEQNSVTRLLAESYAE
ncbi:MAG: hypothetical protein MK106_08605 [Mariniblastus sp.]|nr:hypothetical protein [Mariniblastus sp.]